MIDELIVITVAIGGLGGAIGWQIGWRRGFRDGSGIGTAIEGERIRNNAVQHMQGVLDDLPLNERLERIRTLKSKLYNLTD